MRHYEASSIIASNPVAVWAVLSDGASWTAWDSGVDSVEGRIELGGTIKIRSQVAPGRTFPVKVTTFDPPDGATTFEMREEYTGPLLPLIWRSMPDLSASFERFARGLKQRVESAG